MKLLSWMFFLCALALFAVAPMACGEKDEDDDDDASADSDSDSDVDSDADGDTDSDTDTDSDSDTDTDSDTDVCSPPATIQQVCALIFDPCDGFGFGDVATCENCFINGDTSCAFTGTCADETAYYACMCDCIQETECSPFSTCEGNCWTAACD